MEEEVRRSVGFCICAPPRMGVVLVAGLPPTDVFIIELGPVEPLMAVGVPPVEEGGCCCCNC